MMKQVLPLALLLIGLLFQATTVSSQENGYTYTVQPDDNWGLVAQEVGLTIEQLQEANPQAVRPTTWLIVGEELFIPVGLQAQFYTVQAGDGWTTIAAEFDLSVRLLQATNAEAVRPNGILLVGERLLIPPTPATLSTIATATQTPTATLPAIATPTSTPTIASLAGLPPCPAASADLGQTLAVVFNSVSGERQGKVAAFLASCGLKLKNFVNADLNGDQAADAVLVYTGSDAAFGDGGGLVLLNGGLVYAVGYTAPGAIELLATQDINADGQTDVVWSDTTCGASACFVTVHIRSWDGSIWQDWTEGTISMASADLTLTSGDGPGTPKEFRLAGGLYSGAGAGPQRIRTEVWTSVDGAPYTLTVEVLGPSACLYHTVLDANRALTDEQNLEKAQLLYTTAVENTKLVACWVRQNELSELRSFALFRLALIAGYMGDPARAAVYVQQLESEYAEQIFTDVARLWLDTYQQTADPIRACTAVRDFAAVTPSIVDVLADYGYANPTFTAEEVCPPPPPVRPTSTPTPVVTTQTPRAGIRATPVSLAIELPNCPRTSVDYTLTLPVVVNRVAGDLLSIDAWLRICGALTDERGSLQIYDLSGDGLDDIIIMPTIISDVGYGPNGADGIIVILHQQKDGSYQKAYEPNVYGQPQFLAIGDVNEDGKPELIWQSDSCSTFCISSVWAIVWDSTVGVYRDVITPGAAIAEGTVIVEAMDVEEPTCARRLRFVGGVSGTRAGGLAVPHTEIWHSLDGAPFRRFSWMYERESAGNDCFGLRLVEADIALQTADVVGYDPAIRLYTLALASSALQPCSLHGMDPTEEMALLQGLASFRLLQALTLNNNGAQAESILELLVQEQAQSKFTEAASKWLASYTTSSDPAAACAIVTPIFEDNPTLWQITTQFGYDHPSLAAQQICYVPNTNDS